MMHIDHWHIREAARVQRQTLQVLNNMLGNIMRHNAVYLQV